MKIEFNTPRVPNFIQTNKGLFDIADLDSEEINRFVNVWRLALLENRQKRNKLKKDVLHVEDRK